MTARVILPTYEERESIVALLAELRTQLGPAARILIDDDSSPDGTIREVVRRAPPPAHRWRSPARALTRPAGSVATPRG